MSNGDIEAKFGWISLVLVALVGVAFAAGLILHVSRPGSTSAAVALNTGLVLLMLSPAVRLTLAVAERIRRSDWTFVLMTVAVAVELAVVMWRASQA